MTSARANIHATAVVVDGRGLLITGKSGAGKTSLALTLIDMCRARQGRAFFIADDQVWLSAVSGRLVAEAPETIAGLVELRGFGPASIANERRAIIDALVVLDGDHNVPRVHLQQRESLQGVTLPKLTLPFASSSGSARAILAWIGELDRDFT